MSASDNMIPAPAVRAKPLIIRHLPYFVAAAVLVALAATIIGGFGDVAGAIVGGLALGVIETFGAAYISVPYKDGFAFLVLIAFLVFRPQGIFGERVAEKA